METNEVLKLFSTKFHKCISYQKFDNEDDSFLEVEFAGRDGWNNEDYDDNEDVQYVPYINYSNKEDEFYYGYSIVINGDYVDTIMDDEEFIQEEVEYLEKVIRECFDKI